MAAAVAAPYRSPRDEHHNYDAAIADFRKDLSLSPRRDADRFTVAPVQAHDIDEEVKISKKRKPVAKLDAERLLSSRGVPELRRRAAKRLKFQGKGHEYSDMAQLVNLYQMWLDDMFPRAKFRDGLSLVEKVGHTKRLQVMRKAWIEETRPTRTIEDEEAEDSPPQHTEGAEQDQEPPPEHVVHKDSAANKSQEGRDAANNGGPDEDLDELDALLAAESANTAVNARNDQGYHNDRDDRFADEEEAMADMGDMW